MWTSAFQHSISRCKTQCLDLCQALQLIQHVKVQQPTILGGLHGGKVLICGGKGQTLPKLPLATHLAKAQGSLGPSSGVQPHLHSSVAGLSYSAQCMTLRPTAVCKWIAWLIGARAMDPAPPDLPAVGVSRVLRLTSGRLRIGRRQIKPGCKRASSWRNCSGDDCLNDQD